MNTQTQSGSIHIAWNKADARAAALRRNLVRARQELKATNEEPARRSKQAQIAILEAELAALEGILCPN